MSRASRQPAPDPELPQAAQPESGPKRRSRPPKTKMPRKLGRYRLEGELASGGMATLYLAHDQSRPGAHGVVAIKLLHAHLVTDPTFRTMFFDEARTLA